VRLRDKRLGIAILLLAFAACDEEEPTDTSIGNQFGDDAEVSSDDSDEDDEDGESADVGMSPRRDGGSRDATIPVDASDTEEEPRDGGRRRDGGPTDGGANDAATAPSDAQVPAGDHCAPTASWAPEWAAFEEEVLRLTNEARTKGASCGSQGTFPAAKALEMEPRLRCSARLYSEEMVRTDNFGHTSTDGTKFDARIAKTGYRGSMVGENIAAGYSTPALVVAGWMKSEGHCSNIMQAKYTQIGVGYYIKSGSNPHWTQNFGTPR
jgi:uncharacterized protein YkwD